MLRKRLWKSGPWLICTFLFFATVLNYMDRQTLSMAAPLIQRELHIDNARLGLLLSAFFFTYGIMQLVVGPILDRVNIRWGYAAAVSWWSLAGIFTGLVNGFNQLFACRLMLGIGEAANWPAALRITSRVLAPEERSVANGFFNSGSMAGAIVTPPLMVWISTRWSWRMGFIAIGLLAFIWVMAWLAVTRNVSGEPYPNANLPVESCTTLESSADGRSDWHAILRSRRFWGLMIASTFGNPCYYFYSSWLPTYFVQGRSMSFGAALGGSMVVPFLGLGIGSLLGGVPVLYMSRRGFGVASARMFIIVIATLLMLSAVSVPWVKTTGMALALIFIVTISMGSWLANYLSFCQDVSHKHVAGVAGVLGSFGAFSGAFLIWLTGVVSKLAGGFGPVFVGLGIMPVIATAGILVMFSSLASPQSTKITL